MFDKDLLPLIERYDDFFKKDSNEPPLDLEDCKKKNDGVHIEYFPDGSFLFSKK